MVELIGVYRDDLLRLKLTKPLHIKPEIKATWNFLAIFQFRIHLPDFKSWAIERTPNDVYFV